MKNSYQIENVNSGIEVSYKNERGIFYIEVDTKDFTISNVKVKPKGKRTIISIMDKLRNDYTFRTTRGKEHRDYVFQHYLKYVTLEELNDAAQFVWESRKPKAIVLTEN